MSAKSILICDRDADYLEAVTRYLIESSGEYRVSTCSEPERLDSVKGVYEAVIYGDGFSGFNAGEGRTPYTARTVIRLRDDGTEPTDGFDGQVIDKYGSMDALTDILRGADKSRAGSTEGQGMRITGIYSPARHELQLPVTMAICSMLAERGERVMLLDLEEISMLPELTGESGDLIEYLYLCESGQKVSVADSAGHCEGFSYMPPMRNLSEIAYVTEQQWIALIEEIEAEGYDRLVILFDHILQGFERLLRRLDELVLIGRGGDYYAAAEGHFTDYLSGRGITVPLRRLNISMSAASLTGGSYRIESLLRGNLGECVRREWDADVG